MLIKEVCAYVASKVKLFSSETLAALFVSGVYKSHHANGSKAGLVFVTAFLDRRGLLRYIGDIAWETEVWIADNPDHMIHFNWELFLGPH